MKKYRIFIILFASLLLFPCFVDAQSIQDYRNKIKEIENEKAESEKKSEEYQAKINAAVARIAEIRRDIAKAIKEQEKTEEEIDQLNKDIDKKEQEIKDLLAFYQVSDSENFYLKFIFGAESFEDFIYRFSIVEQLSDANDKLVDEMNSLIKENEKKIKQLEQQEKNLNNLDVQVNEQIQKLGNKKKEFNDEALDADEEIATLEKQIAFFKKEGCSETQDVTTCSINIPSASGFILPVAHGWISSWYGNRWHPVRGGESFHDGVDVAAGMGTTVMASATGKVIHADNLWGFGKTVEIVHNVSGKTYTTLYGHLSVISVRQGQIVDRGTKIGEVGSTGVSTGPHLHFQLMYGSGYGTSLNPKTLVNIPGSW